MHCAELPFGILPTCSYLNIETMNIISSDTKTPKKIVCYSRRNDFTKFFKICLTINKRIDKTEMT